VEVHVKTANRVYSRFIEFEERAAAIYLRLASHFSEDPKLSAFWSEMAMEEKQHAGLLQFCLAQNMFSAGLPSDREIEEINKSLDDIEHRAAAPTLKVDDAFCLAIEMENSEINSIYGRLTTALHSSRYLLQRKIVTSLPNHVDNIVKEARRFGVSETILKEAKRPKKTPA
jgi:rubrerythrin